jgi:hypothetical protein
VKISEVVAALTNISSQLGDLDVVCGKTPDVGIVGSVTVKEVDVRTLTDPIYAMDEDTCSVVFMGHIEN